MTPSKAGTLTVSHLRFGKNPIRSPYLIDQAGFIACHNPSFIEKYDMLKNIEPGGTFLLTTQHSPDSCLGHAASGSSAADHRQDRSSST